MTTLWNLAALIAIGAITPGPNNLIVMARATRCGFAGAVGAIVTVLCGSVALLTLAAAGTAAAFAFLPWLRAAVALGGLGYLSWLGARLLIASFAIRSQPEWAGDGTYGPTRWELFWFQFLNPKGWVMVLSALALAPVESTLDLVALALLFVVIPAFGLGLWSLLGHALTRALAHPRRRAWFDRAMAILLLACAIPLLQWI